MNENYNFQDSTRCALFSSLCLHLLLLLFPLLTPESNQIRVSLSVSLLGYPLSLSSCISPLLYFSLLYYSSIYLPISTCLSLSRYTLYLYVYIVYTLHLYIYIISMYLHYIYIYTLYLHIQITSIQIYTLYIHYIYTYI